MLECCLRSLPGCSGRILSLPLPSMAPGSMPDKLSSISSSVGLLRSLLPAPPARSRSEEQMVTNTRSHGQHLSASPASPSRDVLLVEMVARTLKNILRRWMREGVSVLSARFFSCLCGLFCCDFFSP